MCVFCLTDTLERMGYITAPLTSLSIMSVYIDCLLICLSEINLSSLEKWLQSWPFENDSLLLLSCQNLNILDISPFLFIGISNIFSMLWVFLLSSWWCFCSIRVLNLLKSSSLVLACFLFLVLGVPCLRTPCLTSVHKGQLLCYVLSSVARTPKPA